MVKISIIIPVYNCAPYLKRCLESLLNQTLQDIEIILINDGSKDASPEVCEEYVKKDSRIVIINQENSGQSRARNKGLQIASGEFIGFVDSDDWVDIDFFEKLYSTAKKYNADIAMADFIRTGPKQHKIRLNLTDETVYETIEDKIKIAKALKEGCIWNKIYKKEVLEDIRFNEGMYFEDGPFTIRALYNAKKLVTVPSVYYYYYQNPASTVKTMNSKKRADKQKSRREILDFFKTHNIKIKDKSYWANLKSYSLDGINCITIQESMKSKRLMLFGIPVKGVK